MSPQGRCLGTNPCLGSLFSVAGVTKDEKNRPPLFDVYSARFFLDIICRSWSWQRNPMSGPLSTVQDLGKQKRIKDPWRA